MASKKLLMSIRHKKGELTAIASLGIRDSALGSDKEELIVPGLFSLARAPDVGLMVDITPELVEHFKIFLSQLKNELKESPPVESKDAQEKDTDPAAGAAAKA